MENIIKSLDLLNKSIVSLLKQLLSLELRIEKLERR